MGRGNGDNAKLIDYSWDPYYPPLGNFSNDFANLFSHTGWKLKLKEQFRYGEREVVELLPQRLSEMANQLNANTPMR